MKIKEQNLEQQQIDQEGRIKTLGTQTDDEMFEMFNAIREEEKPSKNWMPVMNENLPDQRDNPDYDLMVKSYLLNEANIWGY